MFYERIGPGDYIPTEKRPSPKVIREFDEQLEDKQYEYIHKVGDGWHYLPGEPNYVFNGKYWYLERMSSEGCVLAHVEDICKLAGINFVDLQKAAYPDAEPQVVQEKDRKGCERPATLDDVQGVLDSLEDINYHSLNSTLEDMLREKGML